VAGIDKLDKRINVLAPEKKSAMNIKVKINQISRRIKRLMHNYLQKLIRYDGFADDQFTISSKTTKCDYERLAQQCQKQTFPVVDNWEKEMGFCISKVWLDELALVTQITIKESELNYQHGRVIYSTLRNYIQERLRKKNSPKIKILEIGTARGFSAICMSKAILDAHIDANIISIDPLPHNRQMYWNCIADIEGKSSRKDLLRGYQKELENILFVQGHSPDSLNKLGIDRINFAFVDGMHKYPNILEEYKFIKKHQVVGDIILFDDIQSAEYSDVGELAKNIEKTGEYSLQEIWSNENRGYGVMRKTGTEEKS